MIGTEREREREREYTIYTIYIDRPAKQSGDIHEKVFIEMSCVYDFQLTPLSTLMDGWPLSRNTQPLLANTCQATQN